MCTAKRAIYYRNCLFCSANCLYLCKYSEKHLDMEALFAKFKSILNSVPTGFVRYLHDNMLWDNRLIAILGTRGVGKTTLILQHIKLYGIIDESLFVTADDLYFTSNTLYDLALKFFHSGGKSLYIDEIHKYKGWSTEIKNIYDTIPDLKVVYTGSSILDLEKGGADLSRRKLQYYLSGMSFREYLAIAKSIDLPVHSLEDILKHDIKFPYESIRPLALFKEYQQFGYYPFSNEGGYYMRLNSILNQTLENDIPFFAQMNVATSQKLKKLLYIIAQSVPFKPNFSKLSRDLEMTRNSLPDLMFYLEKAGVINQLRADTKGIKLLGKVDKVYLGNTNLAYAISDSLPDIGNLRETTFLTLMRVTQNVISSSVSDFSIGRLTFEVGGKGKSGRQIAGVRNGFIVKDDIETGSGNIVPLWAFGLTY